MQLEGYEYKSSGDFNRLNAQVTKNHDKAESESRVLVIESDKRHPANPALEEKNLLWGAQSPGSAVLFCRGVMFCRGALFRAVRGQKAKEMVVHIATTNLPQKPSVGGNTISVMRTATFEQPLFTTGFTALQRHTQQLTDSMPTSSPNISPLSLSTSMGRTVPTLCPAKCNIAAAMGEWHPQNPADRTSTSSTEIL
ncbi:hypothetical protein IHE44_0004435 [Lamprotornis superbus]|uniref:Uncharacterized protein n=1 Tax=Lamprotornis superbus TaxID=245042 RepID=A0A835NG04_9PASS|nr:hypothetical protein IHE44_0004435 [Lamprotornis superbus]